MAYPIERQKRLDPILNALRQIPGFQAVQQQDFDSNSIEICVTLDDVNSRSGSFSGRKPYRFHPSLGKQPIRTAKQAINRACRAANASYIWVCQPVLKYIYNGGETIKDGYDSNAVGILVYI